jgi:hypothetical protein
MDHIYLRGFKNKSIYGPMTVQKGKRGKEGRKERWWEGTRKSQDPTQSIYFLSKHLEADEEIQSTHR